MLVGAGPEPDDHDVGRPRPRHRGTTARSSAIPAAVARIHVDVGRRQMLLEQLPADDGIDGHGVLLVHGRATMTCQPEDDSTGPVSVPGTAPVGTRDEQRIELAPGLGSGMQADPSPASSAPPVSAAAGSMETSPASSAKSAPSARSSSTASAAACDCEDDVAHAHHARPGRQLAIAPLQVDDVPAPGSDHALAAPATRSTSRLRTSWR